MDEQSKQGRPSNEQNDQHLLSHLKEFWDEGVSNYTKSFRKLQVLDQTDRGELWKAIGAKFPPYQILPDTNFVTYVKSNMLASIYCVSKSAEVLPTSDKDKQLCVDLNLMLDNFWDTHKVGFYQFQAGERASLLNLGITQVGWDEELVTGVDESLQKGNVKLKNIDPMKFMRDPYAVDLATSNWCCTYEDYHKSVLLRNTNYNKAMQQFLNRKEGDVLTKPVENGISKSGADGYYTLVCWWVRNNSGGIDEIHTVNNEHILWCKFNIKPSTFPFAMLYCNLPNSSLIGCSEPAKIFANNVAYNLLDSMAMTAEYKNQNPPKFISADSKINIQSFAKHGEEANKTFVVNGDAERAVHYHQFPQVSNFMSVLKQSLEYGIQNVSGVDGHYTGRNTGSIITTGGTEEMLNRVTLIDTPKITMYEDYCKSLTELILRNMLEFAPDRSYFIKEPNKANTYKTVKVSFPSINAETLFQYSINISSELPKNKQRIASLATELLEKQAQYRRDGTGNVDWITEEEWLMFQDLPFKEFLMERMGVQRNENLVEEVAQVLYNYSGLVQNGATADEAMQQTAANLMQTRQGQPPDLENLAQAPQQPGTGAPVVGQ